MRYLTNKIRELAGSYTQGCGSAHALSSVVELPKNKQRSDFMPGIPGWGGHITAVNSLEFFLTCTCDSMIPPHSSTYIYRSPLL